MAMHIWFIVCLIIATILEPWFLVALVLYVAFNYLVIGSIFGFPSRQSKTRGPGNGSA